MKRLALAALIALLTPGVASAVTYKLPDDAPAAIITLPDGWTNKEIDYGVESTSTDEETYLAVEVTGTKEVDQAIDEAAKFLGKSGVTVDEASEKRIPFKVNGMDGFEVAWKGTDKDGPVSISLAIIEVSAEKMLLLTYWSTPAGDKSNAEELGEIINSVQKIAE